MLSDAPPKLLENDPAIIAQECVAHYEELTGKTLQPAQAERLLINVIAYRESVVRGEIESIAWGNLIRFADGRMLDELGEWVRTPRLDGEENGSYRKRLLLAPAAYSTAGSDEAYEFHARSASTDVADVAVIGNDQAEVLIYVLGQNGPADADLLATVAAACSARKVRPLTDRVTVAAPVFSDYAIEAVITPRNGVDINALKAEHQSAVSPFQNELILPGVPRAQIIAALKTSSTYNVDLLQPVEDVALPPGEVARCTNVQLSYTEQTHG